MLDLRTEIDTMNTTSRRIVQLQQVDEPEELEKRLDDMKQRCELLAANLESVKEDLEKAGEILRKFHHENNEVVNFLSTTENELNTCESDESLTAMLEKKIDVEVTLACYIFNR